MLRDILRRLLNEKRAGLSLFQEKWGCIGLISLKVHTAALTVKYDPENNHR